MSENPLTHISIRSGREDLAATVLGIGNAGCRAVDLLAANHGELSVFALNTDVQALAEIRHAKVFQLGQQRFRGLSTGGDPEGGVDAANADAVHLRDLCGGADIVIIVAGLGGGTGTGAGPVIAKMARETGALVVGVLPMPFDLEGRSRAQRAEFGLNQMLVETDAAIVVPNQVMLKEIDAHANLPDTFQVMNENLSQGIRGIVKMVTRPGLINVSFSDLCSLLRGRRAESALAHSEAAGPSRATELLSGLFANPMLDQGRVLQEADALLVSLIGGDDLSISEVNHIMDEIQRRTSTERIVVGASVDPAMLDRIGLTVVACRYRTPKKPVVCINPSVSEDVDKESLVPIEGTEIETNFLKPEPLSSASARFNAPPPELSQEQKRKLVEKGRTKLADHRKMSTKLRQGMLQLETISKGRFENSAPTIHHGEDLDVPTYLRRGIALN